VEHHLPYGITHLILQGNVPALTVAKQAGTWIICSWELEGWVYHSANKSYIQEAITW